MPMQPDTRCSPGSPLSAPGWAERHAVSANVCCDVVGDKDFRATPGVAASPRARLRRGGDTGQPPTGSRGSGDTRENHTSHQVSATRRRRGEVYFLG